MRHLVCFDNGGETFDRYTILNKRTGDMIGSSDKPFAPNGFGQHCGNVADNYWNVAYGYSWRKYCDEKKCIRFAVKNYLSTTDSNLFGIGKLVEFKTLPIDVQKFAKQVF